MATQPNRTATKAQNAKVIAGIDKDLGSQAKIPLAGEVFDPSSLKAVFSTESAAMDATDSARTAFHKAVLDESAARSRRVLIRSALRSFLVGTYGKQAVTILGDFGFTPPKKATLTVPDKAVAVAKQHATRAARGTQGPVARQATVGTVDEAAIRSAITSPAAPPAAAAAPVPPPGANPATAAAPAIPVAAAAPKAAPPQGGGA
jgi:hypothetical protein